MTAPVQSISNFSGSAGSPTGVTLNSVVANDLLFFTISSFSGTATTVGGGFSDSAGNTGWVRASSQLTTGAGGNLLTETYYNLSPAAGTHTISYTQTGGVFCWSFVEDVPCTAVDVLGAVNLGSGAITTLSATSITQTANDRTYALLTTADNPGITVWAPSTPSGFTQINAQGNVNTTCGQELAYIDGVSGSQAATWTFAAGSSGNCMLQAYLYSFKKTSAAGPLPPLLPAFHVGAQF